MVIDIVTTATESDDSLIPSGFANLEFICRDFVRKLDKATISFLIFAIGNYGSQKKVIVVRRTNRCTREKKKFTTYLLLLFLLFLPSGY